MTISSSLPDALGSVRLAPHITFTRLPYGGAVLVNGVTLAIAECGERHCLLIEQLLTCGIPESEDGLVARELAADLIKSGWFAVPSPDQR
ncbi:actinodefensin-associated protein B [Streptomyces sp. NPDC094034]|uniref:actinodefensin-associated protein B n=1 Tax=Streptomyces sp. NPDC094034 TaxID=3155309 RepID=UPI003319AA68